MSHAKYLKRSRHVFSAQKRAYVFIGSFGGRANAGAAPQVWHYASHWFKQSRDIRLRSKWLRALNGSLLKERQRIWCKEKSEGARQRGLHWPGGKSSPTPVRVWASSELMKPTGSTANFSWNHLSGLANLSRLLGLSLWFLALPSLPDISTERDGTRRWQWEQKGILCPADLRSSGWFQPVSYIWRLFDP